MKTKRKFTIETEKETDGRWLAEILELPGVMAYGGTRGQAQAYAEALAFRVLADELEVKKNSRPKYFSNVFFSLS
jgi:predicted RNase H-like HicB family nuclease